MLEIELEPHQPVILLSHIPLFRSDDSSCGPLRESRRGIRTGFGLGYQNLLSPGASLYLLDELHPTLIFRYAEPST
jgi:ethanolamine phosphate phosphodiesterase